MSSDIWKADFNDYKSGREDKKEIEVAKVSEMNQPSEVNLPKVDMRHIEHLILLFLPIFYLHFTYTQNYP